MLRLYPDELRADLQQYYGIDLDSAPGRHSAYHVAALAVQVPYEARVRKAANPDNAWTLGDVLAAAMLNEFRSYEWALSDKRRRGPRPQPIGPSFMRPKDRLAALAMPVDALLAELDKPRTEA